MMSSGGCFFASLGFVLQTIAPFSGRIALCGNRVAEFYVYTLLGQ